MKRVSFFCALLALGVGASALHIVQPTAVRGIAGNPSEITNGAFRDGLYLGRMAAQRGAPAHIGVGRWSTVESRAAFTAGYLRGYSELAVAPKASR